MATGDRSTVSPARFEKLLTTVQQQIGMLAPAMQQQWGHAMMVQVLPKLIAWSTALTPIENATVNALGAIPVVLVGMCILALLSAIPISCHPAPLFVTHAF